MGRPFLLVIPGASGLPEFYDLFVNAVAARGYGIKAIHLPSIGLVTGAREGPLPTMYDDAAFIAKHVTELADAGRDVILVTHSYGGTPATESVQGLTKKERQINGLKGGIIGLAYITSLVPNVGKSAASVQAGKREEDKIPTGYDVRLLINIHVRVGNANSMPTRKTAGSTSFSNMPKEEGEKWAAKLAKHSTASFASPLTYAGFRHVPVSYLVCENDRAIPPEIQRAGISMIERESGNKVNVTSIKADHVSPLSSLDEVVEWVISVASRMDATP
ncbi:hypothetical protein ACJ41O_012818 [Fusarium nematophilum]